MKLVECVPNFSEGRDTGVIEAIAAAIESIEGVRLLHVDSGYDVNRTVMTFIGSPEAVGRGAFAGIAKAYELIDMAKQQGTHPRMGSTDVCPFIPISNVTMEECVQLSHEVGKRVGDELGIPVYLYEKSATRPERENLADIRSGQYEGLAQKIVQAKWKPDYGTAEFNARAGAVVIGAREFLIAYNINLNTRQEKLASDIAHELRTRGRSARRGNIDPIYLHGEILLYDEGCYPCGQPDDFVGKTMAETIEHCREVHGYDLEKLLRLNGIDPVSPEGKQVKIPGKIEYCKAIGWMVDKFDRAQISMNLTNYRVTPMHVVMEEARNLAVKRGLVVTGSEIVGMVPYDALLATGKFYLRRQHQSSDISPRLIMETAIQSLGLRDCTSFVIEERVLGLPDDF